MEHERARREREVGQVESEPRPQQQQQQQRRGAGAREHVGHEARRPGLRGPELVRDVRQPRAGSPGPACYRSAWGFYR